MDRLVRPPDPSQLPPIAELIRLTRGAGTPAASADALLTRFPELSAVQRSTISLDDGATALLYELPEQSAQGAFVWIHGGAFVAGDQEMAEANWTSYAIAATGTPVVSLGYRQAVDGARYPDLLADVGAGWRFAREWAEGRSVSPESLHLGGASAGAALAASLTLRALAEREPPPGSVVLVYPSLHRRLPPWPEQELATLVAGRRPLYLSATWVREMNEHVVEGLSDLDARSAFAGDQPLDGFPPTLLIAGEYDTLRSSAEHFRSSLQDRGVPHRYVNVPGAGHGYLNDPSSDQASHTVAAIVDWIGAMER